MALTETQLTEILKIFKNEEKKFAAMWVKLYKGNPGSAGTEEAAGETTRKQITFSAPSAKEIKNSAALQWTAVSTAETYKYVGFWSAESAGTFYGSQILVAEKTVGVGDTFEIQANKLIIKAS